jgi:hypothetical protein
MVINIAVRTSKFGAFRVFWFRALRGTLHSRLNVSGNENAWNLISFVACKASCRNLKFIVSRNFRTVACLCCSKLEDFFLWAKKQLGSQSTRNVWPEYNLMLLSWSWSPSKPVLDHVVCYGLQATFCFMSCRSSALRRVLQKFLGCPIYSVDMISPFKSLFAYVF